MVRIAALKKQVAAGVSKLSADGRTAQQQLEEITKVLTPMFKELHQHFEKALKKKLTKSGIHLLNYVDLNQEQRTYINSYFEEYIFPF